MAMASAPLERFGSAFSSWQASAQAAALRDDMMTSRQPAWMRLEWWGNEGSAEGHEIFNRSDVCLALEGVDSS